MSDSREKNGREKVIAALLASAKKSEQTPAQVTQGYMQALEEPVLRVLCSILQGDPHCFSDDAVKKAFNVLDAFAEEKIKRGKSLLLEVLEAQRQEQEQEQE